MFGLHYIRKFRDQGTPDAVNAAELEFESLRNTGESHQEEFFRIRLEDSIFIDSDLRFMDSEHSKQKKRNQTIANAVGLRAKELIQLTDGHTAVGNFLQVSHDGIKGRSKI
jgi:hypothetical protein